MRVGVYARVSTIDQEPENQLADLRRYVAARGWQPTEYVDRGVSGAKDRRPALDQLVADARRRRFDVLVVWRLDRLGRSPRHLVTLLDDLQTLGIAFVSLGEGIDATTPAGKLQMHILAAIAEFERGASKNVCGPAWHGPGRAARSSEGRKAAVPVDRLATVATLPLTAAAATLGVSRSTVKRWRRAQKVVAAA